MSKTTSEKCNWCKGSGVDSEGVYLGNPYSCSECKGTGFTYEKDDRKLYYKQMNEEEKKLIEKF